MTTGEMQKPTRKKRNTQPGRPGYLPDARVPRNGEQIGGRFIIFRRASNCGRVRAPEWPFEHGTIESAQAEIERLREKYPGEKFSIWLELAEGGVA